MTGGEPTAVPYRRESHFEIVMSVAPNTPIGGQERWVCEPLVLAELIALFRGAAQLLFYAIE